MNYDKYFFVLIPITMNIHLIFFFYLKNKINTCFIINYIGSKNIIYQGLIYN